MLVARGLSTTEIAEGLFIGLAAATTPIGRSAPATVRGSWRRPAGTDL